MATAISWTTVPFARIVYGTYTGAGAAHNLKFGGKPIWGKVWNITDGDFEWTYYKGLADGYACQDTAAANSVITSNGFTEYDGTATEDSCGITIGTALDEAAKVFRFIFILE